jgi:trk system potassium uptake protein TrkA
VLHGDGSDAEALDLAGLTDMDTFITATGENETNIMSCMLAKHLMTPGNGAPQQGPQNHFAGE